MSKPTIITYMIKTFLMAALMFGGIFDVNAFEKTTENDYVIEKQIVSYIAKDPESVKYQYFEILDSQKIANLIETRHIPFGLTLLGKHKQGLVNLLKEGKAVPFIANWNAKNSYGAYVGYQDMCGFINLETKHVIYHNSEYGHCIKYKEAR